LKSINSARSPDEANLLSLKYGIFPSALDAARVQIAAGASTILDTLLQRRGRLDGLTRALIAEHGPDRFSDDLIQDLNAGTVLARDLRQETISLVDGDFLLTGAEAVALTLRQTGIELVFAYTGTSELALCDKLARLPNVQLINGRGDRESAFLAGGASLLSPGKACALLHGARGSLNATGAISELRRTEIGVPIIVGLPSTSSAPYLPPHGEPGLLDTLGRVAKCWQEWELIPAQQDDWGMRGDLLSKFEDIIYQSRERPLGPTLFGLPQDIAETPWIPWSCLGKGSRSPTTVASDCKHPSLPLLGATLSHSKRIVILIDDYLLSYPGAHMTLQRLSTALASPVLQVQYVRGPMLFERVSGQEVPNFIGFYDPLNSTHADLMEQADFLITLEDRNLYPRVIGQLPPCRKAAITSISEKAQKNGYLTSEDFLIEGNVIEIVEQLLTRLAPERRKNDPCDTWWIDIIKPRERPVGLGDTVSDAARALRDGIVDGLAVALSDVRCPVLIDDSQMLGGLICSLYDQLPSNLRVFGSHGGFVGWGLATAAGVAIGEPEATVICLLGDEGFINGLQGMVAVGQQRAPIVYIICNNAGSVSLRKQALSDDEWSFDRGRNQYLRNAASTSYTQVAGAVGIPAATINFSFDRGVDAIRIAAAQFRAQLIEVVQSRQPTLLELIMPDWLPAWDGIWRSIGNERMTLEGKPDAGSNN
jgi:acetolactate synthase-1/2/3 large subunit